MSECLRRRSDFQKVYRKGKRYEASLLTVFVLPNSYSDHRLGITASRKALGKAVDRNRAKRLVREAFRLKEVALQGLRLKYDWGLNARRETASVKIAGVLTEFETVLEDVASHENAIGAHG